MDNGFSLAPDDDAKQSDFNSLDALIEIQEADNFERIVSTETEKLRLHEREAFEIRWIEIIPDITNNELDFLWKQELADAKELAETQETIEDVLEEFMNALHEEEERMTPEK